MKRLGYFLCGSLAGAAVAVAALQAAQAPVRDAVEVSPQMYTVRLDNDRVRVLDYHLKPGQSEALHSHHPGVAYVITSARVRTTAADGAQSVGTLNAGDVHWREHSVVHAVENIGATDMHALLIELK